MDYSRGQYARVKSFQINSRSQTIDFWWKLQCLEKDSIHQAVATLNSKIKASRVWRNLLPYIRNVGPHAAVGSAIMTGLHTLSLIYVDTYFRLCG